MSKAKKNNGCGKFKKWRLATLLLVIYDLLTVAASYYLAMAIRFERLSYFPQHFVGGLYLTYACFPFTCVVVYWLWRLYNRLWQFASYRELTDCLGSFLMAFSIHIVLLSVGFGRMPISYYVFGGTLQLVFLLTSRFITRLCYLEYSRMGKNRRHTDQRVPAMLIGAGSAGQAVLRDLSISQFTTVAIRCIIDDDADKWGMSLDGIPIVGGREAIVSSVHQYGIKQIFLAIPTLNHTAQHELLNICQETGCEVKLLPGIYQIVNNEVSMKMMRDVEVNDLLEQPPITVNLAEIKANLEGKCILVTGGGGSIGSELCRQIATYKPSKIVIFDIYENNAYFLQQDLRAKEPDVDVEVQIGSVCDYQSIAQVVKCEKPDIIFHAAAHKHLPLMEASPCEAIWNNVHGTYNTACAALVAGCRKFVLLSADKAVNPTSVLGVCHRLNEMLMQAMQQLSRAGDLGQLFPPYKPPTNAATTVFATVRFGNAFDSEGAVMGLFKKQIATGGPVKVTHKDVTRFCMSQEDSVKLILQAVCYADDGGLFVLDMGEPYRIDDIARRLIRLSGFVPDEEIKIEYTGLRPGEKLYERPLDLGEGLTKTACPSICLASPIPLDAGLFLSSLKELFQMAVERSTKIGGKLGSIVTSYHHEDTSSGVFTASELALSREPLNVLEQISQKFAISGNVTAVKPVNAGYINRTYRVDTVQEDGGVLHYLLQRINTNVFPNPAALMENFTRVTKHLREHLRLSGRPDEAACPQVIMTMDNKPYQETPSGAWRMMNFIGDTHSYDIPENPEVFYHSGVAFGAFLRAMADFPAGNLHEVIPNFHNTWSRYQDLEKAIAADPIGRVAAVQPEIEFVRKHKELFKTISKPLQSGEIPLRVGHNDCNLNNILFDNATNLPVAIIDLDTVMPSTPLYDFGDSMRIGTNHAKDDEKDLSKVFCDLDLYEQYARGWLQSCGKILTPKERELLPYAALVITSEDGIRFLMDHINGDTYYYTYYFGQNLDRARTQLKLLEDMEQKLPQIKEILTRLYAEFGLVSQ